MLPQCPGARRSCRAPLLASPSSAAPALPPKRGAWVSWNIEKCHRRVVFQARTTQEHEDIAHMDGKSDLLHLLRQLETHLCLEMIANSSLAKHPASVRWFRSCSKALKGCPEARLHDDLCVHLTWRGKRTISAIDAFQHGHLLHEIAQKPLGDLVVRVFASGLRTVVLRL